MQKPQPKNQFITAKASSGPSSVVRPNTQPRFKGEDHAPAKAKPAHDARPKSNFKSEKPAQEKSDRFSKGSRPGYAPKNRPEPGRPQGNRPQPSARPQPFHRETLETPAPRSNGPAQVVDLPRAPQSATAKKEVAEKSPHASFSTLNLPPLLMKSIHDLNYTTPTPIQGKTIPFALEGKDILGCAQTGTGKTAAFLIPIITQMLEHPNTSALILVPTRELAVQIQEVLKGLTSHTKHLGNAVLIGGMSMQPQLRALQKKPRFIIATPGRMIDHLNRRSVSLVNTAFLVLDEADRMLDMGFIPQLREIFKTLPKKRQTLLFTATLPPKILEISRSYMHKPVEITIGRTSTPVENIKQSTITTTQKEKNDVLMDQLNIREGSIIIFSRTQRRADRLHKFLESYGHKVAVIHGGKSQGQRTRALDSFRNSQMRILVATDVASRGLDIPHVAHVINYDLPEQAEDYVHRIGRTARAGNTGEALSMIIPEEKHLWKDITKLNKL